MTVLTSLPSLANNFLIAMPLLNGTSFSQSVVLICEHSTEGTVGLMVNHPMDYNLGLVFEQLDIHPDNLAQRDMPLLFGGPLQPERGFVIHKPWGNWQSSLALGNDVTITTSNDIIRAFAHDKGPRNSLITLGYMGWSEQQLENEVLQNAWIVCPYRSELLYEVPFNQRWEYAGQSLGIDMRQLISGEGHA